MFSGRGREGGEQVKVKDVPRSVNPKKSLCETQKHGTSPPSMTDTYCLRVAALELGRVPTDDHQGRRSSH